MLLYVRHLEAVSVCCLLLSGECTLGFLKLFPQKTAPCCSGGQRCEGSESETKRVKSWAGKLNSELKPRGAADSGSSLWPTLFADFNFINIKHVFIVLILQGGGCIDLLFFFLKWIGYAYLSHTKAVGGKLVLYKQLTG